MEARWTVKQLDIEDIEDTLPYQRHSDTSKLAAFSMQAAAETQRGEVLRYLITRADGATDEEIQDALQMNPSAERPRRVELVRLKFIYDSGYRRVTRSGRFAVVWLAGGRE
jgi:hypothetical protein